uniref:Retrovirus-related Pol polyprotein from transposon TNT 1-94 n=1 Tax=Cajanus cajan TaxID=3821 RepID=A0A151UA87_CAJCA|nr:Retrovirus-related Pol polyprotein from transposon TNT 1-94 [Cajanus cajan]
MTYCASDLVEKSLPRQSCIINANGESYPVTGAGTVNFSNHISLPNTLLVPSLSNILISVGQATEQLNCVALMYPNFCFFQDILTKEITWRGTKRGGLYYMEDLNSSRVNNVGKASNNKEGEIRVWHACMGHPSFYYMKHVLPKLFAGVDLSKLTCDTCIVAKSHRVPFPTHLNKINTPFGLIHTDVWGPSSLPSLVGHWWFVTFIDDCMRVTWLYFLKHKSEVFYIFKTFHSMIRTQFNTYIRVLRSYNGGEYVNNQFQHFFNTHRIIHEISCPNTPQQNGVAEWKNQHILETARALLIGAHMPSKYWEEAIGTSIYLMNRMPSRTHDFKTPLETLNKYFSISPH